MLSHKANVDKAIDIHKPDEINEGMKRVILVFFAGFLSVLVFHQGLLSLLHLLRLFPFPAYNLSPTEPFGVPAVISSAFFGGLWGIVLDLILRNKRQWFFWMLLGSIGPTTANFLIVAPLKGIAIKPVMVLIGLSLNAAWGLGLFLLLTYFFQKSVGFHRS